MKNLTLLLFIILSVNVSTAQNSCKKIDVEKMFNQTYMLHNVNGNTPSIHIKGDTAKMVLNALLQLHNQKSKGYINKIKNVVVPNISSKLTMTVQQGIHQLNANGSFGFHTFKNKEEETAKLAKLTQNQKEGIIVYFKIKGSRLISKENLNYVLAYFKQLVKK